MGNHSEGEPQLGVGVSTVARFLWWQHNTLVGYMKCTVNVNRRILSEKVCDLKLDLDNMLKNTIRMSGCTLYFDYGQYSLICLGKLVLHVQIRQLIWPNFYCIRQMLML